MVRQPLLVGRDDERRRLVAALDRCRAGAGGVVLVSGEAGIGKSRLVAEVLGTWEGRRLSATATPGAGAYAPLAGLVPTHGSRAPSHEPNDWRDDPASAVHHALRAAARQAPAVLVIEDLHLADAATIEMVPTLAARLGSEPLLVIGIYRSDGLPRAHAVRGMRAELRRLHRLDDIALRPLAEEQTGELLAAILDATPARALVTAVHERSEGVPFFVEELTSALLDGGGLELRAGSVHLAGNAALPLPESVLDAVLVRTSDLRAGHGAAVELAATLGVRVDLSALAALVVPTEIDPLLEAGLLLELEDGIAAFRHALVRDALYRDIPWARRCRHHQRVAEVLSGRGAAPAVVAEHWIAAHHPERARPLLLTAAEEHCAAHAYRDAAALAGRALSLWPEDEDAGGRLATLERLADCADLSGEHRSAADTWGDVAQRRRASGDLARAGTAHRRAANAAELLGDLSRTASERGAAAAAFASAGAMGDAAVERLALAEQQKAAGRLTDALEHAVAATEAADRANRRDVQGHALAFQGAVRSALGDGRRGIELARAGLELVLSEKLTETTGETYYALGEAFEYAADYAAAVEAYESAFEVCRSNGQSELAELCFICTSPAMRLMGNWDRSLAICAEMLADEGSAILTRRVAEEESGLITALRGDRRRARGPLRRAAEFGQANGIFGLEVGATWGLAVVAQLEDDEATARSTIATLIERCGTTQECHYALPALRWSASYLGEIGDAGGVAACHRVVARMAALNGSSKVLSALAHVGAELALVENDTGQAVEQFARSVELLGDITAPYEQANTQLRWGQACTSLGQRDAALASLTTAYRTARLLAAKPLARRSATALAAMGEQVDRRLGRLAARAVDPSGLTPREQEVLGQLADGRTNRQIAAGLFLSTRTVDMHVRNLFTKLDCSSRMTAVRRARERGLLPPDDVNDTATLTVETR